MAIENIKEHKIDIQKTIEKNLKVKFKKRLLLVTLHPTNLDKKLTSITINNLLKALRFFKDYTIVFTYPNQDTFGNIIIRKIKTFIKKRNNCVFVKNLGTQNYFSLIKLSNCIIGNSSSGIIEVPSFSKPTVNIGTRQRGRITAGSVINCDISLISIKKAINKALKIKFKNNNNPFEVKNKIASSEIIKFLKNYNFKNFKLDKKFYDL